MTGRFAVSVMVIFVALQLVWLGAGQAGNIALDSFWRDAFRRDDAAGLAHGSAIKSRVFLGRMLFSDTRLSGNQTKSCASCHQPDHAFTDGRSRAENFDGSSIKQRNTPSLNNLAGAPAFNWDGSAASIEQQVLGPLLHKAELSGDMSDIVARLTADKAVRKNFREAFPLTPEISSTTLRSALASYVRSLRSEPTRFDDWIAGDRTALTSHEHQGFRIFTGKGGCVACHNTWRFTDHSFHDIGLTVSDTDAIGEEVNANAGKRGVRAFKTPTLRLVSQTAPYMHDGRFQTLDEVVEHYAGGVVQRKGVAQVLPKSLVLSDQEKSALVAFLKTL